MVKKEFDRSNTYKGVRVGLTLVVVESKPRHLLDVDIDTVDPSIGSQEVIADDGSKLLNRVKLIVLGQDPSGVLDGVRRDNFGVVISSIAGSQLSFEQNTDTEFANELLFGILSILLDLQETDISFTIGVVSEGGHLE